MKSEYKINRGLSPIIPRGRLSKARRWLEPIQSNYPVILPGSFSV
jgi:hypothetical protein